MPTVWNIADFLANLIGWRLPSMMTAPFCPFLWRSWEKAPSSKLRFWSAWLKEILFCWWTTFLAQIFAFRLYQSHTHTTLRNSLTVTPRATYFSAERIINETPPKKQFCWENYSANRKFYTGKPFTSNIYTDWRSPKKQAYVERKVYCSFVSFPIIYI